MPSRDIIVDVDLWKTIVGLLLVGFSFAVYRRTFPPTVAWRRILLGFLRSCLFLSLLLFVINPIIVETSVERVRPAVLALVDCSRSMSIGDCGEGSRIECALRAVDDLEGAVGERPGAELIVIPFSESLGAARTEGGPLRADGEGTDIVGAVVEAEKAFRHLNLKGMVLLSDGRVTRGMLAPQIEVSVPVFAVGVGDTVRPPDVSIDDLRFERLAYTGTRIEIEAVVGVSGYESREVAVRLLDGTNELDRAGVEPGSGRGKRSVKLGFNPDRPGEMRLSVEAIPVEGEEWTGNNSEVIGIRVLKDRIRVLYIDRFADWNATFLRDLVRRTERFEMTAVTWMPDRGYVELPGYRDHDLDGGAASFDRYDIVVISDDGGLLSEPPIAGSIVRYVADGGALLLLADEHSPLARPGGVGGLEGLLPVVQRGRVGIETGEYEVNAPEDAANHPLALSLAGVRRPPPLPGRIVGYELSSAAAVPLVMADRRGSYPFLAMQRSGGGVAAVVLGFPLWRWKLTGRNEPGPYETLLGGLVRYLVEGERTPPLELESARSAYRTGERIALNLYAREGVDLDRIKGEIREAGAGGGIVATQLFERVGEGRARATIDPLPPGEYEAVVSTASGEGMGWEAGTGFSVLPVSTEFLDVSRDMDFLRRLAGESGGRAVELAEMDGIVDLLDLESVERERTRTVELRESYILLVATLLFLTAEWVLRKLWGLV